MAGSVSEAPQLRCLPQIAPESMTKKALGADEKQRPPNKGDPSTTDPTPILGPSSNRDQYLRSGSSLTCSCWLLSPNRIRQDHGGSYKIMALSLPEHMRREFNNC